MGKHSKADRRTAMSNNRPPLPYPVNDGRMSPRLREAQMKRERRKRGRVAALSASVMTIGGAATMSIAFADTTETGAENEIVFSGGCGVLNIVSASSAPSENPLSVTAGTHVGYTNDLDTNAELHVGQDTYEIQAGQTHTFTMNTSAEVAMIPECRGLFPDYEPAEIVVDEASVEAENDEETDDSDSEATASDEEDADESAQDAQAPADDTRSDPQPQVDEHSGMSDSPASETSEPSNSEPATETDSDVSSDTETQGTQPETEDDTGDDQEQTFNFGESANSEDFGSDDDFAKMSEEAAAVDPDALSDGASGLLAIVAIACLVGVSAAVMRIVLKSKVRSVA
ncbi:hypothetical protein [Haloglycomyces albus]|uniref:hypothetical protein n=1 Tax=Haloglycomyces albus TaxID=526067 RepID=UPI00046D17A3|nr:hypothetical protein [Haloglycomyces albus]